MTKKRPVKSILSDVDSNGWISVTEKQAVKIMALLDEWIEWCESQYAWIADESSNALPEHRQLASTLRESIANVKRHRRAIQTNGQSYWALGMLHIARAASVMVTLNRDIDWFLNHNTLTPTLSRQRVVDERRRWLADLIKQKGFTKEEIEKGRLVRKELRKPFKKEWRKSDSTFRKDLNSLGYKTQ